MSTKLNTQIDFQDYLLTTKFIIHFLEEKLNQSKDNSIITRNAPEKKLSIRYINNSLIVNELIIPLQHRPATDRLVRCFFQDSEQHMSRDMILKSVYNLDTNSMSHRLLESSYQKLNKLMSRSRRFIQTACITAGITDYVWLTYNHDSRGWRLYRSK